jgi:uncharacterized protein involved in exopolysaccharide biosynthesis
MNARLHQSPQGIVIGRIWKRKWLILAVTALAVSVGAAYLAVAEEVYEVSTRLYLDNGIDPTKAFQTDSREDRYFVGSQAEVLRSPAIVGRALKTAPVSTPPGWEDDRMTFVLDSLTVSPVVNTQVLSIRYYGREGDEAVRFMSALVESYKEHLEALDANQGAKAVELLAERESELRAKLQSLEFQHAQRRRSSPLIAQPEEQLQANAATLSEVGEALTAARVQRINLANKLAALPAGPAWDEGPKVASTVAYRSDGQTDSSISAETVGTPSDSTSFAALSKEISRLSLGYEGEGEEDLVNIEQQLRLAILNKSRSLDRLGPSHPLYRQANADLAMWRQMRDESVQMVAESLRKRLKIASGNELQLRELYEAERERAKDLDNHVVQEKALLSEISRTENAYNAVFRQLTDTQLVNEALSAGRASVVVSDLDGGELRAKKVWPEPRTLLAACGLFGFVCGVAAAFIPEVARELPTA